MLCRAMQADWRCLVVPGRRWLRTCWSGQVQPPPQTRQFPHGLQARIASTVDADRAARLMAHLHLVLNPAKGVAHVPTTGFGTGLAGAAEHITRRLVSALTPAVAPKKRPGHRAARCGQISPGTAADLVTDHATQQAAQNGAPDVGPVTFLRRLPALDPAALGGRTNDGARPGDLRLEQALPGPTPIGIGRLVGGGVPQPGRHGAGPLCAPTTNGRSGPCRSAMRSCLVAAARNCR